MELIRKHEARTHNQTGIITCRFCGRFVDELTKTQCVIRNSRFTMRQAGKWFWRIWGPKAIEFELAATLDAKFDGGEWSEPANARRYFAERDSCIVLVASKCGFKPEDLAMYLDPPQEPSLFYTRWVRAVLEQKHGIRIIRMSPAQRDTLYLHEQMDSTAEECANALAKEMTAANTLQTMPCSPTIH